MINYEDIERFCKNQMSSEEKLAFEKKLLLNDELQTEVELYKNNIIPLEHKYKHSRAEQDLAQNLNKLGEEYFQPKKTQKLALTWILRTAAVAAIVIIGLFIFNPKADLYKEYAQHQMLDVQTKGSSNAFLKAGVTYFNSKNYTQAEESLESYLEQENDVQLKLYLGISKLELEKFEEALSVFYSADIQESIFKDKADWYIALTHLKEEETEACKTVLNKISSESEFYSEAQDLLKALE